MPALVKISAALFVAGEVFILAAVGVESWLVLPACVITTFEGGLFFVPAAAALFLAAVMDRAHHGHVVLMGR